MPSQDTPTQDAQSQEAHSPGESRGLSQEEYGERYRADFLTMYHEYVGSADRVSSLHNTANTFFVTANSAVLGLNGYFVTDSFDRLWMAAIAGVFMCLIWRGLLFSYKSLNSAKFSVILDMERQLPATPYGSEWEYLQDARRKEPHRPLTDTQASIPLLFIIIHVGIGFPSFISFIISFIH